MSAMTQYWRDINGAVPPGWTAVHYDAALRSHVIVPSWYALPLHYSNRLRDYGRWLAEPLFLMRGWWSRRPRSWRMGVSRG